MGRSDYNATVRLYELFRSLFTPDHLRHFLLRLPYGERIYRNLPGQGAPADIFFVETTESLRRHGLVDAQLFRHLLAEFPLRSSEILDVALDLGVESGYENEAKASFSARRRKHDPQDGMVKIVVISSNPLVRIRRISNEINCIRNSVDHSEYNPKFQVEFWPTIETDDFVRLLRVETPEIVHFCGSEDYEGGLSFVQPDGQITPAPSTVLEQVFGMISLDPRRRGRAHGVRLVVLSSCLDEEQANAITENVDCVVGTGSTLKLQSNVRFITHFYSNLAAGVPIRTAFRRARITVTLEVENSALPRVFEHSRDSARRLSFPSDSVKYR